MNDEINSFISAYRDALDRQRDLGMQNLENNRRNQFQNIMGAANKVGMLYSNFPERSKIQYDTSTYTPAVSKLQTTYQTGLDKLRSNTINLYNQLQSINEAIADLNSTNKGGSGKKGSGYSTNISDYYTDAKGFQFVDANGKPIRANTWANNTGQNIWDVVEQMAEAGDINAVHALAGYRNANKQLTNEERGAWNTLGIDSSGWGSRD